MRIVNRTFWRTDQIRPIIARVAQEELDAPARKKLVVTLVLAKRRRHSTWVGGHATMGVKGEVVASRMTLKLPYAGFDPRAVAKVSAHEMAHLRGITHREMKGSPRYDYRSATWRDYYAWAQAYPIERIAAQVTRPVTERRTAKLDHAQAMVLKWERAHKRAQTKIRTWKRRVAALSRTIAKAAQPGEGA